VRWLVILVAAVACKRAADDATTSVMSVATRADSPVAMTTFDLTTLEASTTKFEYGRAGTCRLPRDVAAFGIVGCPVQVSRMARDGAADRVPIDYDDQFRLIVFDQTKYEWDGNEVKSTPPKLEAELTRKGGRLVEITDRHHHSYLAYDGDPPVTYPEATQRAQKLAADHDAGMLATARSVPRADWPCARTVTDADGHVVTTTFVYGALAACHFPITFEAEGIVGCPSQLVAEDKSALPFDYQDDRMTEGPRHVVWREDGVALDNAGDHFERTATGVKQTPIGATIELAIADGKLQHVASHATNNVTAVDLAWTGTRLSSITVKLNDRTTTTTLAYDCTP